MEGDLNKLDNDLYNEISIIINGLIKRKGTGISFLIYSVFGALGLISSNIGSGISISLIGLFLVGFLGSEGGGPYRLLIRYLVYCSNLIIKLLKL